MILYRTPIVLALLLALLTTSLKAQVVNGDYIDYHVHVQDSATVQLGYRMLKAFGETPTSIDSLVLDADTVINRLDRAKFKKAWIISNAYWFGSPFTPIEHEYEAVKKQNDWIAEQAARYPGRLTALMSVNPLKSYALTEIQRCVDSKHFAGLKLHFANSKINLSDKAQVAQLQKVFALANKNQLLILLHFRSEKNWNGKANAEILVKQVLPFAKATKIVLAHLGGWGNYDKPTDDALQVLVTYMHQFPLRAKNLYFDLSAVISAKNEGHQRAKSNESWDKVLALHKRIKQIGTHHILFGTDWPLIDIDPYIKLLDSTFGASFVQELLQNKLD
ncbi:amidohydrolase family protein [Spirosoma litoris]